MNRANPYPDMAAPLPLKARQALAVQAALRAARRQAAAQQERITGQLGRRMAVIQATYAGRPYFLP